MKKITILCDGCGQVQDGIFDGIRIEGRLYWKDRFVEFADALEHEYHFCKGYCLELACAKKEKEEVPF